MPLPLLSTTSISVVPPPYPPPRNVATGPESNRHSTNVVPFFDSILRAAPAFDTENDVDQDSDRDNDSASSSTLSLSEQLSRTAVSDWSSALIPHLEQHASLHAFLDANAGLDERLAHLRDLIHTNTGKRTGVTTKVTRLQTRLHQLQLESDKRIKLLYRPKKKREFHHQVNEIKSELESFKVHLHKHEEEIVRDEESKANLLIDIAERKKVDDQLDAIDDDVFGGPTQGHEDEDIFEEQYHILMETIKRLQSSITKEGACQVHLGKSHSLCSKLIKELLVGLNIGIEIGIPTNQKHKTQLWRGSSPTHSANRSRSHVLVAKTLCGDLHTQYLLARAVQRRVAILPRMRVIDLARLPGMTAKNIVDEHGLHQSLEQSYAQAKGAKAHIEGQQHLSRQRQVILKKNIKELRQEAGNVWLELRKKRREIVEEYRNLHMDEKPTSIPYDAMSLPPYKRNLLSRSTIGIGQKTRTDVISLPIAFRRRVDRESMARSKVVVRQVAIEVGGTIEDDRVEEHELASDNEDLPGVEITFGYNK